MGNKKGVRLFKDPFKIILKKGLNLLPVLVIL
jgi:hypothetical protein